MITVVDWGWHDYPDINGWYVGQKGEEELNHPAQWHEGGTTELLRTFMKSIPARVTVDDAGHKADTRIWLTEQGMRAPSKRRQSDGAILDYGYDAVQHEQWASEYLPLLAHKTWWPRIEAFFLYQWKGDSNWDSGIFRAAPTNDNGFPKFTSDLLRTKLFCAFKRFVSVESVPIAKTGDTYSCPTP